ncbi:DUF2937 family protein [Lentibacter algarum]|uniref:DUF2937 family protein n=1 Tax=Lentibacter algarum TaxID=576131 RepID=UPI001C0811E8|nr:DUF2937 family protein [Lentibacter algarum]MBU2982893.1 DUF2937 family protein [Lentibacter algarum]
MILRALTFAGGLAGAAGLSQFPEFSQQYMQRLGGAVDELSRFVAEFDADADALGLSREAALVDLAKGGDMGAARADTVVGTIERHARLSDDLAALQGAGPFTRAYEMRRFTDREISSRALEAFKPALPLSFEGGVFAGAGFLAGFGSLWLLLGLGRCMFSRKRQEV